MRKVILESPFAPAEGRTVEDHIAYARACVRDSLSLGEAPIASHLLYTQPGILDDTIPAERQQGIDAGLTWKTVADAQVFYTDFGWSRGMEYGKLYAIEHNIPWEERQILGLKK